MPRLMNSRRDILSARALSMFQPSPPLALSPQKLPAFAAIMALAPAAIFNQPGAIVKKRSALSSAGRNHKNFVFLLRRLNDLSSTNFASPRRGE